MPRELTSHVGARDMLVVQDQKKPSFKEMPPPPPKFKSVPPPPPPPKFHSPPNVEGDGKGIHRSKSETPSVPGNFCFFGYHLNKHMIIHSYCLLITQASHLFLINVTGHNSSV